MAEKSSLNQAELLQLLVANAVEKGIKAALKEELQPLKEELGKVKILAAKILKEGVSTKSPVVELQERAAGRLKQLSRANVQNITESSDKDMYQTLKEHGVGTGYSPLGETLPDIDIPVPKIYKKVTN